MYISNKNNKAYPEINNDLNDSVDNEKLFDYAFLNYLNYKKYTDKGYEQPLLPNYTRDDSLSNERDFFIHSLERNDKQLLDENGIFSCQKFLYYTAQLQLKVDDIVHGRDKKNSNKNKERVPDVNDALKTVIKKCATNENARTFLENFYNIDNVRQAEFTQARAPHQVNYTRSSIVNKNNDNININTNRNVNANTYTNANISNNALVAKQNSNKTYVNPGIKLMGVSSSPERTNYVRSANQSQQQSNINKVENVRKSNINNKNINNKKVNNNNKEIKKPKKLAKKNLKFSLALAGLGASAVLLTNNPIKNNFINSQSYASEQNNKSINATEQNSKSLDKILSHSGNKSSLKSGPLFFVGEGRNRTSIFSPTNELDNELLNTYEISGNYGLYVSINKKLNQDEVLSRDNLMDVEKSMHVFHLSELQDRLINSEEVAKSLGKNKDVSNIKYAYYFPNIDKTTNDKYKFAVFDEKGNRVGPIFNCDNDTEKYIDYVDESETKITQLIYSIDESNLNSFKNKEAQIDAQRNLIDLFNYETQYIKNKDISLEHNSSNVEKESVTNNIFSNIKDYQMYQKLGYGNVSKDSAKHLSHDNNDEER